MSKNEFLPFGTAEGANVLSPEEYQYLQSRLHGFMGGVARSVELNTVWRQSSVIAAAIAQLIVENDDQDLLDDGDFLKIKDRLSRAIEKLSLNVQPELVQEAGDSIVAIMSQKAVTDAISESFVNIPDATVSVKGKVQLTNEVGKGADKALTPIGGASLGFGTVGSFEHGLMSIRQLNSPYQQVYFSAEDIFYRWTGPLPKDVPEKSTPESTGGVGAGKWQPVNSANSKQDLIVHELDPHAHNDIRVEVATTVAAHNESENAHPELHDFLSSSVQSINDKVDHINEVSLATGRIYKNITEGLQYTQNGEHFKVVGEGADFAQLYLNNNGQAKLVASQPKTSAVKGVNILYDAMNEISSQNDGRAFGDNLFNNTANVAFKSTNNLGLLTDVAYSSKESGAYFITKQYPAKKLPLIKGMTLFCSVLAFSEVPLKDFSVFFRKGATVIASNALRSRTAGKEVLTLAIDIPSDEFDIVEFRLAKEQNGEKGLLELGGFSASYGVFSNFNSAQAVAKKQVSGNLIWDSHNEYSSLMGKSIIDWFLNAEPSFIDDINLGKNTIDVTDRLYKDYDVTHLSIETNVPVYAGASVYSQLSGATLYIQYLRDGKYITTPRQILNAGVNQVVIKTILNEIPDRVRFLIEPVSGSKTRINDFFISYDNINTKLSGSVPAKYRYLNIEPMPNMLCDSFNDISAVNPIAPYNWFAKGDIKPDFRTGQYILGDNVLYAKGKGRLAKSYDIQHLNLNKDVMLSVGCSLHVESGTCKFYAQFMKDAQYLNVPNKECGPGTHHLKFMIKLSDAPTHLNFLFDLDANAQIEVTRFVLVNGLKCDEISAPAPAAYMLALSKNDMAKTQYPPLRNYFIKTEQLALNQDIIKETPVGRPPQNLIYRLLNIAFIGDSWTHAANRYSGNIATQLTSRYGDAGAGWISFSAYNRLGPSPWLGENGNIRPHLYSVAYDDNNKWNKGIYSNCPTPDICTAGSDTVGAKITVKGINPIQKGTLVFIPSNGVFEYRFNQNEWKIVNTQGEDKVSEITLEDLPNGDEWTFELVVKSGLCLVSGMNIVQNNNGVICHKLGATGSRASDWYNQDNEAMIQSFKMLNLDTAFILLGTNDQGAKATPSAFNDYIKTLVGRLRGANPAIDICLIAPCENLRTDNLYPMAAYTEQTQDIARLYDCGYINLQDSFGLNPDYYAADGINPLFNADKIHPEPATGGRLISSTIMRTLSNK
ncbi:SGNH/GDSL hydrolase family protein [Providencia rettgeri]|uniref:tail fiber/spike domain-containing protein n=1 Tax=Providencia rettgeri TaxID=587 RepID=UPI001011104D|nr:GDSL-type esterase/lipase family protein [Providencia rettgeri]RXN73036.1 SGNH/GDSL hydrolase family protein [Providencia rettgeri]